jgi:ring-1,2-phenylacetyl-CoA epoxidase subunit PaaB
MSDTQWPRWEVFKQDTPKRVHQAVGSIHAADPEHALLTARNVFARRPSAVSMWVAPASEILSVTQEELAERPVAFPGDGAQGERERYQVFCKSTHKQSMTFADHVGEVEAGSPQEALARALRTFGTPHALAWMLVPERAIARSRAEDAESWFEPAKEKTYKQQSAYGTVRAAKPGRVSHAPRR